MKRWAVLLITLLLASTSVPAPGQLYTRVLTSFEGGDLSLWFAANDASYGEKRYAVQVGPSPLTASTEGLVALRGIFDVPQEAGGATFATERPLDLTRDVAVIFDIYVSRPMSVALALSSGSSWEWHESRAFPAVPGWNKVAVPLDRDLKAARSSWQHSLSLANPHDVRRFAVIVFPGASRGEIYLDNIRAARATQ